MKQSRGFLFHCLCCHLHLQKAACTWQSFLEQLECIIIVQNFNCVCKCKELLVLHFLVLGPFLLFICTIHVQICQKFFALGQIFFSVFQIILHLCNFHANFTYASSFRLDGSRQGIYLLGFSCFQLFKG